ncbi:MAG TPA: DNA gyrase inhibitor YacG [Burkholderiaceae bacterium]|jgi:endogenous inhibitor of DNA gyrase (YacG/DUF329 family)|nr:DNA gyrase inhibitor YacG [Burkholderiaceae bacterium]
MTASTIPPGLQGPERDIKCPGCGKPCKYGPSNPSRPFCSDRCRNGDFGAWATESYRVPAAQNPVDEQDSEGDA